MINVPVGVLLGGTFAILFIGEGITFGLPELFLLFLTLYFDFAVQVLIHEAGHLIAGIISGYEFVSFRIFSITFIKENGRLTKKKFSSAGTVGQCLMVMPHRDTK